jgi:hypothetical protein
LEPGLDSPLDKMHPDLRSATDTGAMHGTDLLDGWDGCFSAARLEVSTRLADAEGELELTRNQKSWSLFSRRRPTPSRRQSHRALLEAEHAPASVHRRSGAVLQDAELQSALGRPQSSSEVKGNTRYIKMRRGTRGSWTAGPEMALLQEQALHRTPPGIRPSRVDPAAVVGCMV